MSTRNGTPRRRQRAIDRRIMRAEKREARHPKGNDQPLSRFYRDEHGQRVFNITRPNGTVPATTSECGCGRVFTAKTARLAIGMRQSHARVTHA